MDECDECNDCDDCYECDECGEIQNSLSKINKKCILDDIVTQD